MITAKEAREITNIKEYLSNIYKAIEKAAYDGQSDIMFRRDKDDNINPIIKDLKKNGYDVIVTDWFMSVHW